MVFKISVMFHLSNINQVWCTKYWRYGLVGIITNTKPTNYNLLTILIILTLTGTVIYASI